MLITTHKYYYRRQRCIQWQVPCRILSIILTAPLSSKRRPIHYGTQVHASQRLRNNLCQSILPVYGGNLVNFFRSALEAVSTVINWDFFFAEEDLRAGGPRLCEPPCETLSIPRDYSHFHAFYGPDSEDLVLEIQTIGVENNLRFQGVRFCQRRSVFDRDMEPKLTALIQVVRDDPTKRGWIDVARKVLGHLNRKGFWHIAVEIVDPRFDKLPNVFSIFVTDPIFPIWKQVGEKIMDSLDLKGVLVIGCHRIGYRDEQAECPVTIVLGVDHRIKRRWEDARETILGVLDGFGVLDGVAVLVRKDVPFFQTESGLKPARAFDITKYCKPEEDLGTTMNPHRSHHCAGSFGGWLEVLSPDTKSWTPLGISCYHCVFPIGTDLSPTEIDDTRNLKENGFGPAEMAPRQFLRVDAPSTKQLQHEITFAEQNVRSIETDQDFRRVSAAVESDDFVIPYELAEWKRRAARLETYRAKRRRIHDYLNGQNAFGYAIAASGLREVPRMANVVSHKFDADRSLIYWALIRPENRLPGSNKVHFPGGAEELNGFFEGRIEAGLVLWKYGPVTGLTRGSYSAVKTAHIQTRIVDGQEKSVATWEHTLSASCSEGAVLDEGDSGSLVFTEELSVVGMVFGAAQGGDIGYFTHIQDLVADIKRVTGARDVCLRAT